MMITGARHRSSTGLGTTSVLVTGHEAAGCRTWCCLVSWQLAQGWEERTAHVGA